MLEVGQVLWLKVRYQADVVSKVSHPMLIAKVEEDYIEIIAIDKVLGRSSLLLHNYNYFIDALIPKEDVIFEDSYAQLNTKLTIEKYDDLIKYRKTNKKLSKDKLEDLLNEYVNYQNQNNLDERRIVHMSKEELEKINT